MKARTIRVDDELWAAANQLAEMRGESVTSVIRHALNRYTGNFAGLHYGGAAVNVFGGAIVLSNEWDDADPEQHRFHMAGCDVALDGIDLLIKPLENSGTFPEMPKAAGIVRNSFRSAPKS